MALRVQYLNMCQLKKINKPEEKSNLKRLKREIDNDCVKRRGCKKNKKACTSRVNDAYKRCRRYVKNNYKSAVRKCRKVSDYADQRICLRNADDKHDSDIERCDDGRDDLLDTCNENYNSCMSHCRWVK